MALRTKLVALAVALASAVAALPAAAATSGTYVNPFVGPNWGPARTDMGVDWIPLRPTPVRAIGDALILGSSGHVSWPGHHMIWYRLLTGTHAGDVVYVAEHLKHLVAAGRVVHAGQRIATALPGYPWIETGWADQYGSPRAYPCYKEGKQTESGKDMARFLETLGATVADPPGKGSTQPVGKLC